MSAPLAEACIVEMRDWLERFGIDTPLAARDEADRVLLKSRLEQFAESFLDAADAEGIDIPLAEFDELLAATARIETC